MVDVSIQSDVILYYLALFFGCTGIIMMLVFVPFKSVATLIMMVMGFCMVVLGAMVLAAAVVWDMKKSSRN